MRFKLHHPLWTHLSALVCIAINAGFLLYVQLPACVPIHFTNGLPDSWGSPLDLWLTMLGWPLLLLIGSILFDERCARYEQKRQFNWFSLIDELLIGLWVGRNVKMIPQLSYPEPVLSGWWPVALLFAAAAVASAVLLELRRPYRPEVQKWTSVDVAPLAQGIQPQFRPDGRWLYWEKHNSIIWRCLVALITVLWAGVAWSMAKESDFGGVVFFAFLAILSASWYGGIHSVVTPGRLKLRSENLGLAFLRLKLANVQSVEVMSFNVFADFLGWGLYRYSLSLRAWGFVLGGKRGVMIHMKSGRKFFIGSSTPEKLAAATEAARIAAKVNPADVKGYDAAIWNDSDSARTQGSRDGGLIHGLVLAILVTLLILPMAAIFFYSPGPPKCTITSEGLTIHDMFYPATVKAADVDTEHIKVVDIRTDPHWRLTARTNGIGARYYKAGWFRVAGGEKVRMYRTTNPRPVLLPPKGESAPVLLEVKQPEAFIQEVQQAWR
jgi:hypothetical protein